MSPLKLTEAPVESESCCSTLLAESMKKTRESSEIGSLLRRTWSVCVCVWGGGGGGDESVLKIHRT